MHNCKLRVVVPLQQTHFTTSNEALTQVYLHGHRYLHLHTYFSLSILGRPIIQNHGWDTQKFEIGSQKYEMKNIKYGTLPWLYPACQIELSIRS